MSRRNLVIVSLLAVALAGGALVAQNGATPDGTPNVNGKWEGKLKYKNYDQTEVAKPDRGKQAITLDISQKGSAILVKVTVVTGDGPIAFDLTGEIGAGHFWATLDEEGLIMMVICHVSKTEKKIKGSVMAAFHDEAYVSEVKFVVKKVATPE